MKKYNVILADPPWKYHTDMVTDHKSLDHYPSMSNDELKAMDVQSMCNGECVLFMWTTTPNLDIADRGGTHGATKPLNSTNCTGRKRVCWCCIALHFLSACNTIQQRVAYNRRYNIDY